MWDQDAFRALVVSNVCWWNYRLVKSFPGRSARVTCLSEYFFHFPNLKALQCDGFFMCQGETSLHACIHSSCVPCVKGSGQMLWPAHLFDSKQRFKEHQQLPAVLFYLLCFVWTQSWAHHMMRAGAICTMSWLLQCKRMLYQAGQINGLWWGFHRHEVREKVTKMRHRAAPQCPATLHFCGSFTARLLGLESTLFSISCCIPPTASFISQTVRYKVEDWAKVMF